MRLLHTLTLPSSHVLTLSLLSILALFQRSRSDPEIPNFAYLISAAYFFATGGGLWQIRSLQMFWWCKGSSCHQGNGDQVSKLHGLLAPQRVPYGHPNAAPKSAPNLHPGAEHFYWISHKASERMRYETTKIICPSLKKGVKGSGAVMNENLEGFSVLFLFFLFGRH